MTRSFTAPGGEAKGGAGETPYRHQVVAWDEVGEEEGTGIVHIAPGCGAEDFQLGKKLGLPVIGPIDESGIYFPGFGSLSGQPAAAQRPTTDQRPGRIRMGVDTSPLRTRTPEPCRPWHG